MPVSAALRPAAMVGDGGGGGAIGVCEEGVEGVDPMAPPLAAALGNSSPGMSSDMDSAAAMMGGKD
jgi:hypothetical protein